MVGSAPVWIHVDWDALEPGIAPAAYMVPGGLLPEQIKAIFAAFPPGQVVGVELAEFEASEVEAQNEKAVAVILDTASPLFAAS